MYICLINEGYETIGCGKIYPARFLVLSKQTQYFSLNDQNEVFRYAVPFCKNVFAKRRIVSPCGALRLGYARLKARQVKIIEEKFGNTI